MPKASDPVMSQVLVERNQGPETRRAILLRLERSLGRPVVSFFTSFRFPVEIEDSDADMLEGVLQKLDLRAGLALFVNSPGGNGLSAERVIRVCRAYGGTGEYWAVVAGKAKSAATMICFGASRIVMGPTSELGPVDPQVVVVEGDATRWFSAHNIIKSYDELFGKATKEEGHLEPYLQQLERYDSRQIEELKSAQALSEDIAVRSLVSGMLQGLTEDQVKAKIGIFLTPERTKTHGRPIYMDEAMACGLNVSAEPAKGELWSLVHQLYVRTNQFVSTNAAKSIESKRHSFMVPVKVQ